MAASAASSSSDIGDSLAELACPVCFELYKEPITLPCGHSFCCVCIKKCWESREKGTGYLCPNCREVFTQKPKLKKNVTVANLVENIKLKKKEVGLGVKARDAQLDDVNVKKGVKLGGSKSHCELCNGDAAKRCVPCEIVCCEQHLKPHQQKGHKLVDPAVKIKELRCTEHDEKPVQLYCKDDGSFMCLMCMGGQHQNHNVVAVEIAHTELKGVLAAKYPLLSESMQGVSSQLKQVQEEELQEQIICRFTEDMLEEKRRLVCQFVNESVDLMKSHVNKMKMEKLSLLGKQREKLEQQMESLRQGKAMLKTALEKLEAISFLQGSKDLLKRLESMSDLKSVRKTPLAVLDFSKEDKDSDILVKLNRNFLEKMQSHPDVVELDRNKLRSLYGRTPSLDPNSAHPRIKISQDLKTATLTMTRQPYPKHPDRFDTYTQVLSSESFSSGRHYWEVDVSSSSSCGIGMCLNSMRRKGDGNECGVGGNPESWCLAKCDHMYSAVYDNQWTFLSVPGNTERFGFFLDCEAGELRCFGDSRALHVFRGKFVDPIKPAIGVFGVSGSVRFCSF
uniref:E3 ubiquitin/ISG15 ligase TRIM25-like isoform X2 n=1 Tax=Myxine glutinosa TaxID=7769 RepID=UPI00358FCB43